MSLKLFLSTLLMIVMLACQNKSSEPSELLDLKDFVIEEIPGTSTQVAKRYENGNLIEEVYLKNGKYHGTRTIYFEQNYRIKDHISYFDGQLNGYWLKFNNLGRVEEMEQYRLGKLHGTKIKYYSGFPLEIESYKDGIPHGTFVKFYQNRNKQQEVEYVNGVQHGKFRYYNEDGILTLEYLYENGQKVSGGIIR